MHQMTVKKRDKTRNERQARRRVREKQWLTENGWSSWEAVHTALITGKYRLMVEPNEIAVKKQ